MSPRAADRPVVLESVDALSDQDRQRALFAGAVEIQVASAREVFGDEHSGWNLQEVLGRRRTTEWTFSDHVALQGAQVVGMTAVAMPERDNRALALVMVHVHPEARGRGNGGRLLAAAQEDAHAHGRTVLQADTEWAQGRSDDGGAFARAHGFVPAQTTVRSAMRLPADADDLSRLAAGEGIEDAAAFDIDLAWGHLPQAWTADLAALKQQMSTDAPLGETSNAEEDWDVDRVTQETAWALNAGRRVLTVVARDRVADAVVGFTQVHIGTDDPTLGYQQDTLVTAAARGHRLGLRMKAAAARELMAAEPALTRVRTWNAEENAHMLAVNARLGYVVEGGLRVWESRTSPG